jgi:Autochaperone Domain Type 1
LNTALGGSASPADQVIVNGGTVTGLTTVTIRNAGGSGAQTTGPGIPIVVVTGGGTTAPNAFQLSGSPVVGGFEYTLDRNAANQDWFLTLTPASSPSDIQNSITWLANARQMQMITTRLLSSLLLGANEQVNCSNCAGGFASIGSFALGAHTRWALSDRLTLLAGASYDNYSADGVDVTSAPIVAASLRYDLADWGRSRPFAEIGAALSPYETVNYNRTYANGAVQSSGRGSAIDREASIFGRLGWVARLTPIDEGAVYDDLVRSWQQVGGYSELATPGNPFPATLSPGVDTQNVARIGAQYTHLFYGRLEANVNAAFAYGFDNNFGSQATVLDFGGVSPFPLANSGWAEFGARLGYRFSPNFVVDAFVIGTIGGEPGRTAHGGLGVRYAF